MDHLSTEEQQVEAIKKFWKENGIPIVVGAVLGLGGLWGWRYYNEQVLVAQEQASDAYIQAIETLENGEGVAEVKTFLETQSDSSYAILAALQLAKEAVDREDFSEAEKQLAWAAENSASQEIKEIAQLRLARVQNQQEKYTEALSSLQKVTLESYQTQVHSITGDILVKQGKFAEAQESYNKALELAADDTVLKMKVDDLNSKVNG